MSREAERNKLIARLVVERKTDDEIKQAVADFDAKNPQGIQKAIGQFVNFHINNGKRALGLMGAPAAGLAKATETGNPLDFLTGTAGAAKDAIFDPDKEQKEMADVLNMPNNTWTDTAKRFGVNTLTDPTTYMGAGLLKSGLKGFGKQALKGTAIAGAAAATAKQKPDAMGNAALPFAALASLDPTNLGKMPAGTYSQLEREVAKLGRKKMNTMHIARQLMGRVGAIDGIKPDEWDDVGMDRILASRDYWTPEELVNEIQAKRPEIRLVEGTKQWQNWSPSRSSNEYREFQVKQGNLLYPQSHWDTDTVGHFRSDMSTSKDPRLAKVNHELAAANDEWDMFVNSIDEFPEEVAAIDKRILDLDDQREELLKNSKKDYLLFENQSDLHQAANKKITPKPKVNADDWGWRQQQLQALADWEKLPDHIKKAKVGYATPDDGVKADKYTRMLENSVFGSRNMPDRRRARTDYHNSLVAKLNRAEDRAAMGTGPVSPPNIKGLRSGSYRSRDVLRRAYNDANKHRPKSFEYLSDQVDPEVNRSIRDVYDANQYVIEDLRRDVRNHEIPDMYNPYRKALKEEAVKTDELMESGKSVREVNEALKNIRSSFYDNAYIGANFEKRTAEEAWDDLIARRRVNPAADESDQEWIARLIAEERNNNYHTLPHNEIRRKANLLQHKPPANAVMKKTWPLFNLKMALKDAVDRGADRFGIIDGEGINRILQHTDSNERKFLTDWHDKILPSLLESFLRGQGVKDFKFGAKEAWSHNPTGPLRDQYQARMGDVTDAVKELVKKGMPLYAAIAMVRSQDGETR